MPTTNLNDGLRFVGFLRIYKDTDAGRVLVHSGKNKVVNNGKNEVLNMLIGNSTAVISKMSIGNGNLPNTAVDETAVALENEIDIKDFESTVTDSLNRIVTFTASFRSSEYTLVLEEINEAALMFDGISMFSKKTFSSKPFLAIEDARYIFVWSIGIV